MQNTIKVIGFDADDTLWVNEPFYQDVEKQFCQILKPYLDEAETSKELFKTEMQNLEIYGYGAKGFILSMVETALRETGGRIASDEISKIIETGKLLLTMPIQLLNGVENVLQKLQGKYKLILATKGDLLDQEQKLKRSGLICYFHHIEIMSDKQEANYLKLLAHLDIEPDEFLMVGNSVKSDILPVINIGARAIHIPFEVMWQHEKHHEASRDEDFITVSEISEISNFL
ncbi:MAG: HAD family hydrolase [Bacteroidota bacterium]|nr:HAD family hydrolase [Odoribacter sp.]MDP3644103.1 HAD family hydrolase [Bacteroidota bacterium]